MFISSNLQSVKIAYDNWSCLVTNIVLTFIDDTVLFIAYHPVTIEQTSSGIFTTNYSCSEALHRFFSRWINRNQLLRSKLQIFRKLKILNFFCILRVCQEYLIRLTYLSVPCSVLFIKSLFIKWDPLASSVRVARKRHFRMYRILLQIKVPSKFLDSGLCVIRLLFMPPSLRITESYVRNISPIILWLKPRPDDVAVLHSTIIDQ